MVEMAFDAETKRLEPSTDSGQWPRESASCRVLQKVSGGVDCTEVLRVSPEAGEQSDEYHTCTTGILSN
jgi:hypothetical protein